MTTVITYETDHCCYYCSQCETWYDFTDVDYIGGHTICPEKDYDDIDHEIEYTECDCPEMTEANISDMLEKWTEANPSPDDIYRIEGVNMGWRNLSGYNITDIDYEHPTCMMGVNSDFTQKWSFPDTLKGSEISIIQSHHDAPTGESYVIKPLSPLDYLLYLESERYDDFDNLIDQYSMTMGYMPEDYSSEYPTADEANIVLTSEVFGPDRTYWTAAIAIEGVTFDVVDETKEDALNRMKDAIDILNSYAGVNHP